MNSKSLIALGLASIVWISCDRRKITRTDTETSGYARIATDACFIPVMKEELEVFTGLNPEARIDLIPAGERELVELLVTDSVRLIVATRELNKAEQAAIEKNRLLVRSQKIASDGIALIIHKSNPDSMISTGLLKRIMTGETRQWKEVSATKTSALGDIRVVFDNPNSGTLRYIRENITEEATLSESLRALGSNPEVIDFVAKTPGALGVIGVNWISNPDDSTQLSFNETIRVMSVGFEEETNESNTFKPYPVYLSNGYYPLTRDVFVILSDLRQTLPSGFMKFFAGDAGQRIVLKAGLVPATRPTREISLKEDFGVQGL